MKKKYTRADEAVIEAGITSDIALARAYIMAGSIGYALGGHMYRVEKAGAKIPYGATLYRVGGRQYVSRGGYKLEKGLQDFAIDVRDTICLDIGASTGGFTDCLLQHGARRVYALDVGENLLHERLRNRDDVIEKRGNIKYLTQNDIGDCINIVVADLSFISVEHIFQPIIPLLQSNATLLILVKPQFELPKKFLRKGIVHDIELHMQAVDKIVTYALGFPFTYKSYTPAGIKGKKGNQEYIVYFRYNGNAFS